MKICKRSSALVLITVLVITFHTRDIECGMTSGTVYTKYPGFRLQSPCISGVKATASSLSGCVARCSQLSTCVSGSYTEDGGVCCVSGTLLYQDGAQFIQDAQSVYFQTRADVAWHGEWALAFRGSQGIGDSIYTEFLDTSRHDDHPVGGTTAAISCWSLSGSHSCSRHLRSDLLNSWAAGTLTVQKVKFSFYKDGAEVANIVFNGAGSDLTSWFTSSRVVSSSYTDLTSSQTYNYFDVYGVQDGHATRRFYVSHMHNACPSDIGWLATVERATCAWETFGSDYPYFLYSPYTNRITWESDISAIGQADVLAIFVQL